MKNQLSIEQSQKLISLGVDPKLASAICLDFNGTFAYISGEEADWVKDRINEHYYTENPIVFSLADLLSILPKEIDDNGITDTLNIWVEDNEWCAKYEPASDEFISLSDSYCESPELIDALYQLLIWHLNQQKQ